MFGSSLPSSPGFGAIIVGVPSAPVNLTEVVSGRSKSSLAFSWINGTSDGGLVILDYMISYVGNN